MSEIVPYNEVGGQAQVNEGVGMISAPSLVPVKFNPIPIPEGWETDLESLGKPTDKERILRHPKGFLYISIGYVVEKLNTAFGAGHWYFERTNVIVDEPRELMNSKKQPYISQEIMVEGYIRAPGLAGSILGIGSAFYLPNSGNPKSSTIAAAETIALKNAARKLGIGVDIRDLSDDDEGAADAIEADQKTAETMFNQLVSLGNAESAIKIVKEMAPEALKDDKLLGMLIPESKAQPLREALVAAMIYATTNNSNNTKDEKK